MSNEQNTENKDIGQDAVSGEGDAVVEMAEEISSDELGNSEVISEEQAKIAELEKALAAANQKLDDQKDSVVRALADAENARKRAEQEIDKARKFALERFAGELLNVVDNLERATMSADAEDDAVKPLLEGIELTHKSFITTVEKFGIEVIDPQGETFNPELHQAMSMQESAEVAPNTVLAVMQKGYTISGRLLRPAMVMVSRAASDGVNTTA